MPTKLLAPRRILVALAIAFVLGSASVLALTDEAQQAQGEVPASWGVPVPHAGDRGLYNYTLIDAATNRAVGREVPYLAFEQREERTFRADGGGVEADVLLTSAGGYDIDHGGDEPATWKLGFPFGLGIDRDGHLLFFEGQQRLPFDTDAGGTSVAGVEVLPMQFTGDFAFKMRFYWGASEGEDPGYKTSAARFSFCGARHALQGTEVSLEGSVPLLFPCGLDYGGVDTTVEHIANDDVAAGWEPSTISLSLRDAFTAVGVQQIDGKDALVLAQPGRGVRMWFTRDIPYPVQIAVEEDSGLHVLRLREFSLGAEPLRLDDAGAQAPAADLRPAEPWGMADGGTGAVFPIHDAWAAAVADGPLEDYLTAHPGAVAYQVTAGNETDESQGSDHRWWSFRLTDGGAAFAVDVHRHVRPVTADSPVPLPAVPYPVVPLGPPKLSFDYPDAEDAPAVSRDELAAFLPTMASMQARAEAFQEGTGTGLPALWLECAEHDDGTTESACSKYAYRITAEGSTDVTTRDELDPLGLQARHFTAQHDVEFAEDGGALQISSQQLAYQFNSAPAALRSTAEAPYEAPPGTVEVWDFPAFKAVAGVGFLAALAGALYLAWPALKGAALGLFSRVTGNELLEHPQRQRLLAAIEAQPGIHLKELARQTGLAWGQTQHHIGKLVESGAVVAKPSAGYTCYFPKGQDRRVMASAAVLKADGARRLLAAIATTAGLSVGQLSRSVGLTESTAHYHLKRLEAAGLVSTHLIDGARRVTLTALGSEAGRRFGAASGAASVAA